MSKTILGLDLGSNSIGLLAADNKNQPTDIIPLRLITNNLKRRNSRLARRTIQRRSSSFF